MSERRSHAITIAGVPRELPVMEVSPGVSIAVLNILGDTELIEAAAGELAERLAGTRYDTLVTPEAKSIPLAHALSVRTGTPYVVLRKRYKAYMGDAVADSTESITDASTQTLYLDERDSHKLRGKASVLVDDVFSTGSTLTAMRNLVARAGSTIAAEAAILTEGDPDDWPGAVALGHVPLF